jgi:hypothetical protein
VKGSITASTGIEKEEEDEGGESKMGRRKEWRRRLEDPLCMRASIPREQTRRFLVIEHSS